MAPTGTFAISSLYAWDTSNLYTTGEITLTAIPEPASVLLAILEAMQAREEHSDFPFRLPSTH